MQQCIFDTHQNASGIFSYNKLPDLPSSEAVNTEMKRLSVSYPTVCLSSFGSSVMGRQLLYICTGSGKRRVFFSASHHANEWISTLILLKFINELLHKAQKNERISNYCAKDIIKNANLCFAPLINPDGVDLVLGKLNEKNYFDSAKKIAENYPAIPFPSGWKANIDGIDLNLQYPANWERAKKIKYEKGFTSPAPRDYVGSKPLSAPESNALARLTQLISPDLIIALHTQGKEIYWQFNGNAPEGAYELGLKLAAASKYSLTETPPQSDNAGYKDWFIQEFKRPGYTVEMGLGESPLPLEEFDSIYSEMEPLLTVAAAGY